MDIAIRYYSKTGHTKKLAQAISEVTNVEALSISHKLESNVDILFLGTSIYGNSIDPQIPGFFDSIDVKVGKIVNFSTAGTNISTYEKIKQLASQYDIELSQQEFHCLGEFGGMNLDKPDSNDIENIKEFTRNII
ncbi:MAG: flavodoxin [Methanosphaera sp.]|nr:flavodoxin [Methanosphaera sp.]